MVTREEHKANLTAMDCDCGPTEDGGFQFCSGEHFGGSFAGVEGKGTDEVAGGDS